MSEYTVRLIDYSGEPTTVTLPLPQITAANHDTVIGTNVPALKAAIIAATKGNFISEHITHSRVYSVPSVPNDKDAQRELGLEVTWYDSVDPSKRGKFTFGTVDLTLFAEQGTDLVDLEEIAPAALVTAIESFCESPLGNAITVTKMRIVGRRN
jgi:hypothetical protein